MKPIALRCRRRPWAGSRPLTRWIAGFVAGIAAGAALWAPFRPSGWVLLVFFAAACGLGGAALFGVRGKMVLALASALLLGATAGTARAIPPASIEETEGVLTGVVADLRDRGFTLRDAALDGRPMGYRVAVSAWSMPPGIDVGCGVRMSARVRTPQERRNPGGYDDRASLWRQGIGWRASGSDIVVTGRATLTLNESAMGARHGLATAIDRVLPGWEGGVLSALLLGVRDEMPEELTQSFREIGVAHILAVSGLHVGFLVAGLGVLLRPIGKKPAAAAAIAAVWGYAWLVGFMPSIVRASVMVTVAQAGVIAGRKPDGITSLSLSALIILAVSPLQLFSPAFLLSFSAVGGLVLLEAPIGERLARWKLPRAVAGSLSAGTAAQLGTLPVSAALFNQLPLLSLIANLPVIPLAAATVTLGAVCTILSATGITAAAMPVGWVVAGLIRLMAAIAGCLSGIPGTLLRMATPSGLTLAVLATLLLALSPKLFLRRRAAVCAALIACCAVSFAADAAARRPRGFEVIFVDVGQGDAAVLRVPDATVVVDTGPPGTTLARYAQHTGLSVDAVFITHPHDDHAGGLLALIEAVPVRAVVLPATARGIEGEPSFAEAMARVGALGIPVAYMERGDTVAWGEGRIEALWPPPGEEADDNLGSLVLRVTRAGSSALLAADIDGRIEELLSAGPADLLKVAHHGSRYSSGTGFLAAVRPALAVISSGRNSFGHPSPETLGRLAASGAEVLRTDTRGMITVRFAPGDGMAYRAYLPGETRSTVTEVIP